MSFYQTGSDIEYRMIQLEIANKGFSMAPRPNCASQRANDPTVATHDTQVFYFQKYPDKICLLSSKMSLAPCFCIGCFKLTLFK